VVTLEELPIHLGLHIFITKPESWS